MEKLFYICECGSSGCFWVFQFMFSVRSKEEEVLICLQQEDRRVRRKDGEGQNLPIGFEVLRVSGLRPEHLFRQKNPRNTSTLLSPLRWR